MDDQPSHSTHSGHSSHGHPTLSRNATIAGFGAVLLLLVLSTAFLNSQITPQGTPSNLEPRLAAIEQRLAIAEQKLLPPVVTMRLFYDSRNNFTDSALQEVARSQASLAQQGLAVELQDVSQNLQEVRRQGYYFLPGLYLSEEEALKNTRLYQAMLQQPRAEGGFRIDAFGFITTSKSSVDLECRPGNSSARLYEFGNPHCPNCAALDSEVKSVLGEFGGKLEYRFRYYPANDAPLSRNASQAGLCGRKQGKEREFLSKLFSTLNTPGEWAVTEANLTRTNATQAAQKFVEYSSALGMNSTQFSACLADLQTDIDVEQDVSEGITSYELKQRSSLMPVFVIDCKHAFLAQKPGELKQAVCRARPELC